MIARMTLYGFEKYTEDEGGLFNNIDLPEGRFDKSILTDLIFDECGDLYPYYQNPYTLKRQIEQFFARYKEQFTRAWDALYSDYNPIENYDRHEAWSDSASNSESTSESVHASTSNSDSSANSLVNQVAPYDDETFKNRERSASDGRSAGQSSNDTQGNAKRDETRFSRHDGRIHGNIGVTTTQKMINESLELANFDIYLWIVILFREKLISSIL